MDAKQRMMLDRLYSEFKLATGCTDPAAIAAAVAKASDYVKENEKNTILRLQVELSANVFKNAFGVDIPGSSLNGVEMAAALGFLIGQPELGFEIFTRITDDILHHAEQMVMDKIVTIHPIKNSTTLKIKVLLEMGNGDEIELVAEPEYLLVDSVCKNGIEVFRREEKVDNKMVSNGIQIKDLVEFIQNIPLESLQFVSEGVETNDRFVKEGLRTPKGLKIGENLSSYASREGIQEDLGMKIKVMTAYGVDSRMGGSTLPVMSSAGSGNLGIGATIPLIAVCEHFAFSKEKLIRATALSNLIHVYIKELTGKLTSACGGVLVGLGTAAAIVWLLDGTYEQMEGAMKNLASNLTGMICDGANYGCSFKVSTSAVEAYFAANFALQGCIATNMGIVDEDINKTIGNVANIYLGMNPLDSAVLEMMVKQ